MARKIIIAIKARIEINKTVDWMLRNWSPRTASNWHAGLIKTINQLAEDPGRLKRTLLSTSNSAKSFMRKLFG